jgi:hypothetical protein
MQLLAAKAQEGSVTAIVALERALRTRERGEQELDDAIDKIMADHAPAPGPTGRN